MSKAEFKRAYAEIRRRVKAGNYWELYECDDYWLNMTAYDEAGAYAARNWYKPDISERLRSFKAYKRETGKLPSPKTAANRIHAAKLP